MLSHHNFKKVTFNKILKTYELQLTINHLKKLSNVILQLNNH